MPSDPDDNIAVVTRLYELFGAKDITGILAMIDPDVHVSQTPQLPWGGEYDGHDGITEFFVNLVGAISSTVEHETMFAAGDRVVQLGRTRGTVNATGTPFDVREVHILTLADGRITRFEAYIDTPAMLEALET